MEQLGCVSVTHAPLHRGLGLPGTIRVYKTRSNWSLLTFKTGPPGTRKKFTLKIRSMRLNDPAKQQFAEELLSYSDTFNKTVYTSFKGDTVKEAGGAFDYLETALHKFDDGPFFLGQFSLVDIAYAPFIERFQIFFEDALKYDITSGRPKLAAWIEELNKIDAYPQTKCEPKVLVEFYKKRFLAQQ